MPEQPSADISPEKARRILKDGTVHGKPLTEAQRGMFGAAAGRGKSVEKGTKAMTKDAEALPEGGDIETSEPSGEVREEGEMADEKYSAQLLRELHADLGQFLAKYDEARGPLEHEEIDGMIEEFLQDAVEKIERVEEAFGTHHPDAKGLGSEEDVEEAGSEEEEETPPEETVEAMKEEPERKHLTNGETKALKGAYRRKAVCPECGKENCICKGGKVLKAPALKRKAAVPGEEEEQEKPGAEITGEEIPNEPGAEEHQAKPGEEVDTLAKGLLGHERKAVGEAAGFLGELGQTQELGEEHRFKAWHYGKTLEGMSQIQRAAEAVGVVEGGKGLLPEISDITNVVLGDDEKMHPHRKMCKGAAGFLKSTAYAKAFGDEHRAKALSWHKELDAISKIEEAEEAVGVEGPEAEEDIVPGGMDTKALKETLARQNQEMKELGDKLARLPAALRL